jgi:hypothetical protein
MLVHGSDLRGCAGSPSGEPLTNDHRLRHSQRQPRLALRTDALTPLRLAPAAGGWCSRSSHAAKALWCYVSSGVSLDLDGLSHGASIP